MTSDAAGSPGRSALQARQVEKLRALLAAVLAGNSFYTAKLRTAGLDASVASLEEFSRRAPFTLKQELVDDQLRNPPYGTNLTYPLERYSRFNQTSGTTGGQPLRWLDTPESWSWMLDCWARVFEAADAGPRDRIFFPFSFGPFLGFWTAFEAATRMGSLAIPGGGMRSSARLRVILDNDVTVVCATPTYAIRLAEVAAEEKLDLTAAKVRSIIVAGEPGGSIPATRALIERLWPGARVVDHHGMTEIGPVTYECPQRRGVLHVIEAAYFAEIIDPQGLTALGPGETGELVLTNLGRTGSPLLRYRTRDLVRRAQNERCECGSYELALEGGILGRTDDMVLVRGVNLYPSAVEQVLRSCNGVGEFRVEISGDRALPELNLRIEPASENEDTADLSHRVQAAFQNAFGLRATVGCVNYGTLPRFEAKAQRWVRR
jgi:phenylacetate-CoA ligase